MSFNPEFIRQWTPIVYFAAACCLLLILGVLGYLIAIYVISGVIYWYMGWFALIIFFFVAVTIYLKKTHHLHVHHYTIGMVIIVLIGY